MTPAPEAIAGQLRRTLLLPLEDLPCVMRELEFTDRLFRRAVHNEQDPHEFARLCEVLGIETRPRHPPQNGMVEFSNGRIEKVLRSHHFRSGKDFETTLTRDDWLYNHLPEAALKNAPRRNLMQHWYQEQRELFHQRPDVRAGFDA